GRGSIREAIRRLAADRIVHVQLHRGARVRALTLGEIRSIYQVREVLEGLASRLAAQNATKEEIKGLQALEKNFDQHFDGTTQEFLRYNDMFHRLIVRASGNAELVGMIQNLEIPPFILLVHELLEASSIKTAQAEHRPIVAAIAKRNAVKAERAMRVHIRN